MSDRDGSHDSPSIGPWALAGVVLGVVLTVTAIHMLNSFFNNMFTW